MYKYLYDKSLYLCGVHLQVLERIYSQQDLSYVSVKYIIRKASLKLVRNRILKITQLRHSCELFIAN